MAGGLNVYGFAGGDPVNFSDPFGLCVPTWLCNAWAKYQSWRSEQIQKGEEWKRAHGNPQLVEAVVPSWSGGPANLERSAATLARQAKRFANAVKALDKGHRAIAAREAAGEVTGWDHVTEVTSSMNAMRRIIRSMSGYLKNPNLTAEMRAGGEQLLQNAQDALARAEQVMK